MLNDLRHGLRNLLNARGWTVVVVACLALGIGVNTALFGALTSLFLRPLAVDNPGSLVRLRYAGPNDMSTNQSDYGASGRDAAGRTRRATFSYAMYRRFVEENRTMSALVAGAPFGRVNVAAGGEAEIATAFVASGNFFQMLGVTANPGRILAPGDDRPDAPAVAVISHGFWQARFGGAANVVGTVVTINTIPVTIVGVLQPEFTGIQRPSERAPDITFPLSLDPQVSLDDPRLDEPTSWWLQVMGRLKPGVTAAQVAGNLGELFRAGARSDLDAFLTGLPAAERSTVRNRTRTAIPELVVDEGGRGIYEASETDTRALAILGAVAALVLLLVCANVANLLLSRAAARQREVSVRLSLGATRGRLIRQLLTESLLLASMGGALGVLMGRWSQRLLPGALGQPAPADWRLLAFALGATAVTALLFGIIPALRSSAVDVNATLKQHSRGVVASRTWLGQSLLVVQVSISLVLLVGAGLFLRTVDNLRRVDVGFNPQNLLLFRVSPRLNRYDADGARRLYQDILDRTASIGGVEAVAASQVALLSGGVNSMSVYIQGRSYGEVIDRDLVSIHRLVVTPGFFDVMQMPLLTGRGLTDRDSAGSPRVAVINAAAARRFFPGENPIGQHVGPSVETSDSIEIVGVLGDAKYNSVRDGAPPTMYVSSGQYSMMNPSFVVRTAGEPMSVVGPVREAVRRVDPTLPVQNVTTQMDEIEHRFDQEKLFAQAYVLFGGLALSVATVGLFGLMSYSVSRRTNEIGVRMALGARTADVTTLVMGESLRLVAVGVGLGVLGALVTGRLIAGLLYGVAPADGWILASVTAVLVVVTAGAAYLPARRAARVDPVVALREE